MLEFAAIKLAISPSVFPCARRCWISSLIIPTSAWSNLYRL
jgi:hypothetical protein